jgi:hypothetical protein
MLVGVSYYLWRELAADLPTIQAARLSAERRGYVCYGQRRVPDPLQSVEYARAVILAGCAAGGMEVDEAMVTETVRLRQRRGDELRADPSRRRLIIDQAALVRPVGSRRVMAGQHQRLAETIDDLPVGAVGIIPTGVPQPLALNDFTIVEGRVWVRLTTGELEHSDERHMTLYQDVWAGLADAALYGPQATDLLHRVTA